MSFNELPKSNAINENMTVTFPVDVLQGVVTGDPMMWGDSRSVYIEKISANTTVEDISLITPQASQQPLLYDLGGKYILVGGYSNQIWHSTNLKTWTRVSDTQLYDGTTNMSGMIEQRGYVNNGVFYQVVYFMTPYGGNSGNVLFKTLDGVTWTKVLDGIGEMYGPLVVGDRILIATTLTGSPYFYESLDAGATWGYRPSPFWWVIGYTFAYYNGLYVAVGTDSMWAGLWLSTDGVSWTHRSSPNLGDMYSTANFIFKDGYMYFAGTSMSVWKMKLSSTNPTSQPITQVGYTNFGMSGIDFRGQLVSVGSEFGYVPKNERIVYGIDPSSAPFPSWPTLLNATAATYPHGYLVVASKQQDLTLNVASLLETLYKG